jgi:hypothetical protein
VRGIIGHRTDRVIRVDGKLTERRDEASLDGIERTQETGAELRFLGHKPVTSGFGRRSALLDAEEVRGSNPLAPTKILVTGPFLSAEPAGSEAPGRKVDEKLTRRVGDDLKLSAAF